MLFLLLATVIPCGLSFSQAQEQDVVAITSFIAKQARRERGEEYEDARKVVVGDLNGDKVLETVVLYTIESQGGSNNYIQYLAIFTRRNGHLLAVAHTSVGGKLRRSVELDAVVNLQVNLQTMSYGPKDPSCCPSIKATTSYVLVGQTLRERKTRVRGDD